MPNHVTNKLTINGNIDQIAEIKDFLKGENGLIDFNNITPCPKWVFKGDLGEDDKEKYGADNCWYQWNINNWETKWNAYGIEDESKGILFETAWASPIKLMLKLGRIFKDIEFILEYADEDTGYNVGRIKFKDVDIVEEYYPEKGSTDAVKMSFEIRGISKDEQEEFGYSKDGIYIEEDEEG